MELVVTPTLEPTNHNQQLNNNNNNNKVMMSIQPQPKQKAANRGKRSIKRVENLLSRPSYSLKVGTINAAHLNRTRLRYLLRKLIANHNWVDACAVLSALLKATCRDKSPLSNRFKYWVAMELFRLMESDPNAYSLRIGHLYDTWKEKIKSNKRRPLKDRSVMLEYILSCLARKNSDLARSGLQSLLQERETARDIKSNLIIGLTYYELWYSELPTEIRLGNGNSDESCLHTESETVKNCSVEEDDAASIYETFSNLHCNSETSVMNDKDNNVNVNQRLDGECSEAMPVERNVECAQSQSQDLYMDSDATSGDIDGSVHDDDHQIHSYAYANMQRLQSLLPIKVPSGNIMEVLSSHRRLLDDQYKEALKFLKLALQSPPPISEAALLPLIQLLLIGGRAKEAISVLEQYCSESSSVLSFRLKARLWECFDAHNYDKFSTCFEDVLKKDPTCSHSLTKLIDLHIKGSYATDRLVEMIALHLEATYGDHTLWKEFALCLLKLSHCEEDNLSVCANGEQVESEQRHTTRLCRSLASFVDGMSGKTWKFRCKWWLNRHFSKHILVSEIAEGDLKLITYKAACASHLYGREMVYVVCVLSYVKEHDRTLFSFLHSHMQNSVGIFSSLVRKQS